MHNLGFRLLGFRYWVPWRSAKTFSKECWGPCHGWIPSLWDFAQNYSPQNERPYQNWRGTFYSLDSEKAIEPCISRSWWTFDWVALVVQVCAEICSVCQLGRPLFQPRTPWHDRKLQSELPAHALLPKNHCGGDKTSLDISRVVAVSHAHTFTIQHIRIKVIRQGFHSPHLGNLQDSPCCLRVNMSQHIQGRHHKGFCKEVEDAP